MTDGTVKFSSAGPDSLAKRLIRFASAQGTAIAKGCGRRCEPHVSRRKNPAIAAGCRVTFLSESIMRAIILWLLGVPASILILLYLFGVL